MGGVGSGRRVERDTVKRQRVIDKAWDLVEELLNSGKKMKYLTARDIVVKDVAQTLKGEGFNSEGTKIVIIRNGQEVLTAIPKEVNAGNPISSDAKADSRI